MCFALTVDRVLWLFMRGFLGFWAVSYLGLMAVLCLLFVKRLLERSFEGDGDFTPILVPEHLRSEKLLGS